MNLCVSICVLAYECVQCVFFVSVCVFLCPSMSVDSCVLCVSVYICVSLCIFVYYRESVCLHVCTCVSVWISVCVCTSGDLRGFVYAVTHLCESLCVSVFVGLCLCM